MAIKLTGVKARVAHLNLREEKHGEDPVLAIDVKLELQVANGFLDDLEPGLRTALYRKETQDDAERQLFETEDYLPVVRFPLLEGFRMKGFSQTSLVEFAGQSKQQDIAVAADVNDLRFDTLGGGSVTLVLRVQWLPPPEQIARISAFLGKDVTVSISPADPDGGEA